MAKKVNSKIFKDDDESQEPSPSKQRPLQFVDLKLLKQSLDSSHARITGKTYQHHPGMLSRQLFATDLIGVISLPHERENVVFAPAALQAALAFIFHGAQAKTANEIQGTLKIIDCGSLIKLFDTYVKTLCPPPKQIAPLRNFLVLYAHEDTPFAPYFVELGSKFFETQLVNMDFQKPHDVILHINGYFERKTDSRFGWVLHGSELHRGHSLVLINVVHFHAKWAKPFALNGTQQQEFKMSQRSVQVNMMRVIQEFYYANVRHLNSKVIELPFLSTDWTMLVLLPNDPYGFNELLHNLVGLNVNQLVGMLELKLMDVRLPKFQCLYEVDLKEPLSQLGMPHLFSEGAHIDSLFECRGNYRVSIAKQKTFIKVNEDGVDSTATTFDNLLDFRLDEEKQLFEANHPFVYIIRNTKAVFFVGHVTKLSDVSI